MTEEPRTPLTLEYSPEGLEDDPHTHPVIIAEPSFAHSGRIFVGVHPLGHVPNVRRAGVHLLPDDARRLMNHLAKLLMEEPSEEGEPLGGGVDWQKRIEQAAARVREERPPAKKRRRRRVRAHLRPEFRFEFQVGRYAGVIGTKT